MMTDTDKLTPHQQHEVIKRRDAGEPVPEIVRSNKFPAGSFGVLQQPLG
jgi:hypothetical protein